MSKLYVISDPHIGHDNVAKKRGFTDHTDHDAYLKKKWN